MVVTEPQDEGSRHRFGGHGSQPGCDPKEAYDKVREVMEQVGLAPDQAEFYPRSSAVARDNG